MNIVVLAALYKQKGGIRGLAQVFSSAPMQDRFAQSVINFRS